MRGDIVTLQDQQSDMDSLREDIAFLHKEQLDMGVDVKNLRDEIYGDLNSLEAQQTSLQGTISALAD